MKNKKTSLPSRSGEGLGQYGIKVIRFTNEEVLNKGDWVLSKIKDLAQTQRSDSYLNKQVYELYGLTE